MVRNRHNTAHAIKIQNGEKIPGALPRYHPRDSQTLSSASRNGFEPATDPKQGLIPTPAGHILRRRLWRYGPVAAWIALICWASTDQFSSEHTAQVIQPWITWLFPSLSPAAVDWLHGVIRKSAHVTEYAIFALLAARALIGSFRPLLARRWFVICCFLLAALATTDEYHQSFVPSRTAAITDVLIDISGGLVALMTLALWRRWRRVWKGPLGQFNSVAFFREQRGESPWEFTVNDRREAIIARVEVPGFAAGELAVNLQGNLLILRGVKEIEAKGKNRDPDELSFQELYRCTTLPTGVDPARAQASYCDGVLIVTLPKFQTSKIARMPVEGRRTKQPAQAVDVARGRARQMQNDLEPIRIPSAEKGTVPFCSADSKKGNSPRRFSARLRANPPF